MGRDWTRVEAASQERKEGWCCTVLTMRHHQITSLVQLQAALKVDGGGRRGRTERFSSVSRSRQVYARAVSGRASCYVLNQFILSSHLYLLCQGFECFIPFEERVQVAQLKKKSFNWSLCLVLSYFHKILITQGPSVIKCIHLFFWHRLIPLCEQHTAVKFLFVLFAAWSGSFSKRD